MAAPVVATTAAVVNVMMKTRMREQYNNLSAQTLV
jgi:hypothetical protein